MVVESTTLAKQVTNKKLGQTGKRICCGGKTDKTCRIWLSGDKIHLL